MTLQIKAGTARSAGQCQDAGMRAELGPPPRAVPIPRGRRLGERGRRSRKESWLCGIQEKGSFQKGEAARKQTSPDTCPLALGTQMSQLAKARTISMRRGGDLVASVDPCSFSVMAASWLHRETKGKCSQVSGVTRWTVGTTPTWFEKNILPTVPASFHPFVMLEREISVCPQAPCTGDPSTCSKTWGAVRWTQGVSLVSLGYIQGVSGLTVRTSTVVFCAVSNRTSGQPSPNRTQLGPRREPGRPALSWAVKRVRFQSVS